MRCQSCRACLCAVGGRLSCSILPTVAAIVHLVHGLRGPGRSSVRLGSTSPDAQASEKSSSLFLFSFLNHSHHTQCAQPLCRSGFFVRGCTGCAGTSGNAHIFPRRPPLDGRPPHPGARVPPCTLHSVRDPAGNNLVIVRHRVTKLHQSQMYKETWRIDG